MRKIKEVCRLRLYMGLSINQIARSCRISKSTASRCVNSLENLGVSYEVLSSLDEEAVYRLRFPEVAGNTDSGRVELDFDYLAMEMKRKGVTLQLLYE